MTALSFKREAAISRRDAPEVCNKVRPKKSEGAGECRVPMATSASLTPATGARTTRRFGVAVKRIFLNQGRTGKLLTCLVGQISDFPQTASRPSIVSEPR